MEIKDLRQRVRKLENEIRESVFHLTSSFKEETGISPSSISISMVDVTSFGSSGRECAIGTCKVEIDI